MHDQENREIEPAGTIVDVEDELTKVIGGGKSTRWVRIVIQSIAGAISAAAGGFEALVAGGVAGTVAGSMGAWSEAEQSRINQLLGECLRLQRKQIDDITRNVMQIMMRLNLDEDATAARVESPEYQNLLRRAFRLWTFVESEERREYLRRLLTHAGDPRLNEDDYIRLFIDWIGRYSELHFRVIKELHQNPGSTRADIWNSIHGQEVREDSKEADIFKCLISDLSIGHVIRQERQTDGQGNFLKQQREKIRRGSGSHYMTSAFEDSKAYYLTAIGTQYVHFTMTELVPKIDGPAGTP
jgi:hypothetical protein